MLYWIPNFRNMKEFSCLIFNLCTKPLLWECWWFSKPQIQIFTLESWRINIFCFCLTVRRKTKFFNNFICTYCTYNNCCSILFDVLFKLHLKHKKQYLFNTIFCEKKVKNDHLFEKVEKKISELKKKWLLKFENYAV